VMDENGSQSRVIVNARIEGSEGRKDESRRDDCQL
jgi:hypothetical protein